MSRSASRLTGQNVKELTSYLRCGLARNARAYPSARSIGFCVIWVCISSSSGVVAVFLTKIPLAKST
jgi:hypothetical protein